MSVPSALKQVRPKPAPPPKPSVSAGSGAPVSQQMTGHAPVEPCQRDHTVSPPHGSAASVSLLKNKFTGHAGAPVLPKNPPVARVRPLQSVTSDGSGLSKSTPDVRVPPPLPDKPPCGDLKLNQDDHTGTKSREPYTQRNKITANVSPTAHQLTVTGKQQNFSVSCSALGKLSAQDSHRDSPCESDRENRKQTSHISPKVPPTVKTRPRRKTTDCFVPLTVCSNDTDESVNLKSSDNEGNQVNVVGSSLPGIGNDTRAKEVQDDRVNKSKEHKGKGATPHHKFPSAIAPVPSDKLPIKPPRLKKLKKFLPFSYSSEDSIDNSSASDTESSKRQCVYRSADLSAEADVTLPVPKPRHSKKWRSDEGSLDEFKNESVLDSSHAKSQSVGSLLESVEQSKCDVSNAEQSCSSLLKQNQSGTRSSPDKVRPPTKPKPPLNKKPAKNVQPAVKSKVSEGKARTVEVNNNTNVAGLKNSKSDAKISRNLSEVKDNDTSTQRAKRQEIMSSHRRSKSYERAIDDDASSCTSCSPDVKSIRKRRKTVEVLCSLPTSETCDNHNYNRWDSFEILSKTLSHSLCDLYSNTDRPLFVPPHPLARELNMEMDFLMREKKSSLSSSLQQTSPVSGVETRTENSDIYFKLSDCSSDANRASAEKTSADQSTENIYQNEEFPTPVSHGYRVTRKAPPPPKKPAALIKFSPSRTSAAYDEGGYLKPKHQQAAQNSDPSYMNVNDGDGMTREDREDSPGSRNSFYESISSGPYEEIPDVFSEPEYVNEEFPRPKQSTPSKSTPPPPARCRKLNNNKGKVPKDSRRDASYNSDDSDDEYIYPGQEKSQDRYDPDEPTDLYMVHCDRNSDTGSLSSSSSHEYIPMGSGGRKVAFDDLLSPDDKHHSVVSEESFSSANISDNEVPVSDDVKKQRKIYYIAKEIMTTEQTFVDILKLLNIDFRAAVDQMTAVQDRPVIPSSVLNQILNHLPQLQVFNSDLLTDLENRVWNWEKDPRICDIFVKKGPFLKLYTNYIKEFENSTSLLFESCKKYPVFNQVVRDFEASARCAQLELKDYMLKPIQRIPQYRLLLQDYLKHLTEGCADYEDAKSALEIVSAVANHANDSMRYGDQVKRMLELQNSLIGQFEVVQPGRTLIKEGELMKLSRKVMQPRYFVLLNDVLLYTTPTSAGYKLNNVIPLTGMRVSKPKREDFQNEFSILSTQRSFTLCAGTPEEREAWLKAMSTAVTENLQRKYSFGADKAAQLGVTVDKDFELGSKAPVWITDSRVSMCMLCNVEFTFTFRRHHCRACGKVVCGLCSDFKAPLRYLKFKPARVCEPCFDRLAKEFEDMDEDDLVKAASAEELGRTRDTAFSSAKSLIMTRFKGIRMGSFRAVKSKPSVLKQVHANDDGADISGYLKVLRGKRWKKMWFVIKDKVLYTYRESEDTAAVESKPLLGFNIQTFPELPQQQWFEGAEPNLVFLLEHKGTDPTYFRTETEASTEKWTSIMREATVP